MGLDIDGLVCDLDGVVYRGDRPVEGAVAALRELRERGVRVLFATNNSRPTVEQYLEKLRGMGLEVDDDQIVTSSVTLGEVLRTEERFAGRGAVVVGGEGLSAAVNACGAEIGGDPADAALVAVGWDPGFSYEKMRDALWALRSGAALYATNEDATFPAADGTEWPGAGAILASIERASGKRATVVGKPNAPMSDLCRRRLPGLGRIAVVGDRPETDLAMGAAQGWATVLVTSGVTDPGVAATLDPAPDLVLESIAELPRMVTNSSPD